MRFVLIFAALIFSFPLFAQSQQLQNILPTPVSVATLKEPAVEISALSFIVFDAKFSNQGLYLQQQLLEQTGLKLTLSEDDGSAKKQGIHLTLDTLPIKGAETYQLLVSQQRVTIKASSVRGIINGIQTLMQLAPLQKSASFNLPACNINDYPRFAYRGMHLDVVRHFFPVAYIKKYIDYLTFHKLNTFHWHLTDDQGWRIEMLSYPRLNSVASWRDSTLIGHFTETPAVYERQRYGGYYTRAEIKEIIAYAGVRGITIIPEVDIPGHSRAAITAYPELSTNPSAAWGVASTWGMYNRQNNVLAPTPATFRFLRTVFHEIADLFPSTYIHLGGDECSKLWWKQSPATQAFMKQNGLKNETELQTYFIEQVSGYLKEKNKKVIGWHEIMEGKLDTSTIIMNWANDASAIGAVNKGFSVIMTPEKPYYFDHYQAKNSDSLSIRGYNPLEAVYRYDPVPAAIRARGLSHKIIGGQANLWTEYIGYPTKIDYMVFPRMTALSESLWTPASKKNYPDFIRRLKTAGIPRYKSWNSHWFPDFEKWDASR